MPGVKTKPAFPRIYHRQGAPDLWLLMEGPRRTFPDDAGDVADLQSQSPAAVRSGDCDWGQGVSGPCLTFGGAGHARFDGVPSISRFTMTACVEWAPGETGTVVGMASNAFILDRGTYATPGSLSVYLNQSETWQSFGPVPDGPVWITAVCDGTNVTAYLNGARLGSPIPFGGSTSAWGRLGRQVNDVAPLRGRIHDFRFYFRACSTQEIAREAADPYWRLRHRRRVAVFASGGVVPGRSLGGRTASTIRNTISNPAVSDELIAAIQSGSATLSGRTALAIRFALANAVAADELVAAVNGSAVPLSGATMASIRFALGSSTAADELIDAVNAIGPH